MRKRVARPEKFKKARCMKNYKNNILSYWKREKSKSNKR